VSSELQFKVYVIESSDVVMAGMVKQTEGHQIALSCKSLPQFSSLVGWSGCLNALFWILKP
jgi:hypothetical protein